MSLRHFPWRIITGQFWLGVLNNNYRGVSEVLMG